MRILIQPHVEFTIKLQNFADTLHTGYNNVGVAQQQIYVTHNVRLYPVLDVAVVM